MWRESAQEMTTRRLQGRRRRRLVCLLSSGRRLTSSFRFPWFPLLFCALVSLKGQKSALLSSSRVFFFLSRLLLTPHFPTRSPLHSFEPLRNDLVVCLVFLAFLSPSIFLLLAHSRTHAPSNHPACSRSIFFIISFGVLAEALYHFSSLALSPS